MEYTHLTVGDLHLYDKEMRSSKQMVKNSRVILDRLYDYLQENEDVILLNINGDIQHKTPSNVKNRGEVAYWRYMFGKIGRLMQDRLKKAKGYKVFGVSEEVEQKIKRGEIYPIFTTKGNHDMGNDGEHTFYDDLLMEGLIVQAKGLLMLVGGKRTYFNYRDYGTVERTVPKFTKQTDVVTLEHADILHEESLLWDVPKAEEKFLKAEDVIEGSDVVILHHIHESVDPLYIGKDKKVLWQVGSMGRTSFTEGHKRDKGYGALMRFGDVENFHKVEFDLIPYKEYFSYKKILKKKEQERDFKDFSLKVDEHIITTVNYEEEINNLEDVDEKVKEYAIEVMKEVGER